MSSCSTAVKNTTQPDIMETNKKNLETCWHSIQADDGSRGQRSKESKLARGGTHGRYRHDRILVSR